MVEVVELSITPVERSPGVYRLNVSSSGFVPNQTVCCLLGGEDQGFEDFISAPSGGRVFGPDGMFFFTDTATGANLSEDWGPRRDLCRRRLYLCRRTSPQG